MRWPLLLVAFFVMQAPARVHLRIVVSGRAAAPPKSVTLDAGANSATVPVAGGFFTVPVSVLSGSAATIRFVVDGEAVTLPGILPERLRWEDWTVRLGSMPDDDIPQSVKVDPKTACVVQWETAGSDAIGWVVPNCRRALPRVPGQ